MIVALYDSSGALLIGSATYDNVGTANDSDGYYWAPDVYLNELFAGQTYTLVLFTNGANPAWGTTAIGNLSPVWATVNYSADLSAAPAPARGCRLPNCPPVMGTPTSLMTSTFRPRLW